MYDRSLSFALSTLTQRLLAWQRRLLALFQTSVLFNQTLGAGARLRSLASET
jgi:hypothetical protein